MKAKQRMDALIKTFVQKLDAPEMLADHQAFIIVGR